MPYFQTTSKLVYCESFSVLILHHEFSAIFFSLFSKAIRNYTFFKNGFLLGQRIKCGFGRVKE